MKLWPLIVNLLILNTQIYAQIPARAFDDSQCGLNYPKVPESSAEAPVGPFRRHNFADEYWPLVCKSIGRYNSSVAKLEQTLEWSLSGPVVIQQSYTFKKATVAAGKKGENLKMGECAFPDRPLNNDEPNKITTFVMDSHIRMKIEKTIVPDRGATTSKMTVQTDFDRMMEEPFTFFIYVKNAPILRAFDSIPLCDRRPLGVKPIFYLIKG